MCWAGHELKDERWRCGCSGNDANDAMEREREILLAPMLQLDRLAPRISSARKLVPFLTSSNGTSDILAVALRTLILGGAGPEPSHKSLAEHPTPTLLGREKVRADKLLTSEKVQDWKISRCAFVSHPY